MTVTEQTDAPAATDVTAPEAPAPAHPVSGALLPANLVAEREQDRLRRRNGRTGVAATVADLVHGVRWLGGGDAASRGLRYLPAAWTVIAVAAVALYLPGDAPERRAPAEMAVAAPAAPVTSPSGAPTTAPPGAPVGEVAVRPAPVPTSAGPSGGFTPSAPVPGGSSPAPVTADGGPPAFVPPVSPDDAAQLELAEHAWASPLGDVGVAVTPVPDGALPVAARFGRAEKVSYLRLTGEGSMLLLVEDHEGTDESFGEGQVRLCALESGDWDAGPGQRLAEMPAWTDDCADGTRVGDRWTFDLEGVGDPRSDDGWALVPGDDPTPSFQLTFRAS